MDRVVSDSYSQKVNQEELFLNVCVLRGRYRGIEETRLSSLGINPKGGSLLDYLVGGLIVNSAHGGRQAGFAELSGGRRKYQ